jgi:hypothetical protein
MGEDFVCWDFGPKNELCWERPLGLQYGIQTQKLIQEAMPYGFKPIEKDDYQWFHIVMDYIRILSEAGEFENYREWVLHATRYLFKKDYSTDLVRPPPILKAYSLRGKKPEFTYQGIIEAAKEGKYTFSFAEILESPVEIK